MRRSRVNDGWPITRNISPLGPGLTMVSTLAGFTVSLRFDRSVSLRTTCCQLMDLGAEAFGIGARYS